MTKRVKEYHLFPERIGMIAETERPADDPIKYEPNPGEIMYGNKITMDDGSVIGVWSDKEQAIKQFRQGRKLVYVMRKELTEDGSTRNRFHEYEFMLSMKYRMDVRQPDSLTKLPHMSMRYAIDYLRYKNEKTKSNQMTPKNIKETYDLMYNTMRQSIKNDDFSDFDESDSDIENV